MVFRQTLGIFNHIDFRSRSKVFNPAGSLGIHFIGMRNMLVNPAIPQDGPSQVFSLFGLTKLTALCCATIKPNLRWQFKSVLQMPLTALCRVGDLALQGKPVSSVSADQFRQVQPCTQMPGEFSFLPMPSLCY